MATIGLDMLHYAKITEDENGNESYGTPKKLAKAMSADLSVELAEATLYADDGAAEIVKEFKSGTLSLGVDDIGAEVASDLTGAVIDNNGVVISTGEDGADPVAIGFRAKKSNGKYKYFWLYRVKFGIPATALATKGDSITCNCCFDGLSCIIKNPITDLSLGASVRKLVVIVINVVYDLRKISYTVVDLAVSCREKGISEVIVAYLTVSCGSIMYRGIHSEEVNREL